MSTKIDDGGPAFPIQPFVNPRGDWEWGSAGVSVRDYFAAKALPQAWESEHANPTYGGASSSKEPTYRGVAAKAYLIADAMIAERNKETK